MMSVPDGPISTLPWCLRHALWCSSGICLLAAIYTFAAQGNQKTQNRYTQNYLNQAPLPTKIVVMAVWELAYRILHKNDDPDLSKKIFCGLMKRYKTNSPILPLSCLQIRSGNPLEAILLGRISLKEGPSNQSKLLSEGMSQLYFWGADHTRGIHFYTGIPLHGGKMPPPARGIAWHGESIVAKTVAIMDELGFGDSIQMWRYMDKLAQLGAAKIIFQTKPRLVKLFKEQSHLQKDINVEITSAPSHKIECDFYTYLLELPHKFGIPDCDDHLADGYLETPENHVWGKTIGEEVTLKVGICWRGSDPPCDESGQQSKSGRSIKLDTMEPLFHATAGWCKFVPLQRGLSREERQTAKKVGVELVPELDHEQHAFERTIELLTNLDVVLTIDTALAHLAGAIRKRCFVLLPHPPEHRWQRYFNTTQTPFYKSLHLIRHDRSQEWASSLEEASRLLYAMAKTKNVARGGHQAITTQKLSSNTDQRVGKLLGKK